MQKKQNGFTIVELLVVIVVIGILAAITIVSYNGVTERAQAAKNKTVANEVVKKAEIWGTLMGSYPNYGQLKTNSTNPARIGPEWLAGGTEGPQESKLSPDVILVENTYPRDNSEIGYIECSTPGGFYAIYADPSDPTSGVVAIPIGSPTPITYGSNPSCS